MPIVASRQISTPPREASVSSAAVALRQEQWRGPAAEVGIVSAEGDSVRAAHIAQVGPLGRRGRPESAVQSLAALCEAHLGQEVRVLESPLFGFREEP